MWDSSIGSCPGFTFGYPFVMAWYWMTGRLLYGLVRERHEPQPGEPPPLSSYPPVSILVPCHNEGDNVREVFAALDAVDYPDFEIIGINDGSRDNTGEILDELAASTTASGSCTSRTTAARRSRSMPARSPHATRSSSPSTATRSSIATRSRGSCGASSPTARSEALTGNPRIRNRSSLLARLQVGEYSAIVGLIKRAQTIFGWVFTVSGVVCAFRKRALPRRVGGPRPPSPTTWISRGGSNWRAGRSRTNRRRSAGS